MLTFALAAPIRIVPVGPSTSMASGALGLLLCVVVLLDRLDELDRDELDREELESDVVVTTESSLGVVVGSRKLPWFEVVVVATDELLDDTGRSAAGVAAPEITWLQPTTTTRTAANARTSGSRREPVGMVGGYPHRRTIRGGLTGADQANSSRTRGTTRVP
jgi:hypothetical protein